MTLRGRVERLRRAARDLPRPGELSLIVCVPPGDSCFADGRPAGVYPDPGGTGVTVVFDGPEPDPAVLGPLRARLAPWGKVIVCHPGDVPPPPNPDV